MSKELLEMFKKVFDDHFCRETVIVLGYDLAARDGLLTEDEDREFVEFMMTHPHKILSMQRMRDAGMATPDVLEKDLAEAMGDKPEEKEKNGKLNILLKLMASHEYHISPQIEREVDEFIGITLKDNNIDNLYNHAVQKKWITSGPEPEEKGEKSFCIGCGSYVLVEGQNPCTLYEGFSPRQISKILKSKVTEEQMKQILGWYGPEAIQKRTGPRPDDKGEIKNCGLSMRSQERAKQLKKDKGEDEGP